MNPLMNNQIRFSGSQRGVRKIEFQAPCTYSCTYSIYRHTNHVKSNLCGGISNLRGGTSNLRIFDINPATKFEYGGKSNLVAPDLPSATTLKSEIRKFDFPPRKFDSTWFVFDLFHVKSNLHGVRK